MADPEEGEEDTSPSAHIGSPSHERRTFKPKISHISPLKYRLCSEMLDLYLKMYRNALGGRVPSDPPRELTAFPQPHQTP